MNSNEAKNATLIKEAKRLFKERFVTKSRTKKTFSIVDIKGTLDFKIKYANRNIAYIGVTESLVQYRVASVTSVMLGYHENFLDSQYVIITDCNEFLIWSGETQPKTANSIDQVYEVIVTDKRASEFTSKKAIALEVYKYFKESNSRVLEKANIYNYKDLTSKIEYDAVVNQANFLQEFEISVFGSFLDDVQEGSEVYRYTSLSTLLKTIINCRYRLNCIVAMNDRSEINYVDRYLNNNLDLEEVKESEVKYANKRFISSLTERKDDLTLWRMYTDNAAGVCMAFKANPIAETTGFFLKKVSYANSNNHHVELDVLKNLLDRIKTTLKVDFKLYTLYIWKHFFKPHEYIDEKEVRLLYYNSKPERTWSLNTQNGIVSPFVEFDLFGSLPIELQSVILGPRLLERDVNRIQIEEAIVDSCSSQTNKQRKRIKVSVSRIKSYR